MPPGGIEEAHLRLLALAAALELRAAGHEDND
jgi:hypothetical protein